MAMEGFLSALYFMTTGLIVFSYVPQVWRLAHDRTDSSSISLVSWVIWVYAATVSVLYAVIVNGDPLFILSTTLNGAGCYAVLFMAVFNRYLKTRYLDGEGKSLADMLRRAAEDVPDVIAEVMPDVVPEVEPVPVPVRVRDAGERRES